MNTRDQHPTVLVPWSVGQNLTDSDAVATLADALDEPPAFPLDSVQFYVLPYSREVNSGTALALDLIAEMPSLTAIQTLTAGYDHLRSRIPSGVTLCNGRGMHDASTAEHALSLMLAAQREIPTWVLSQQSHSWAPHFTRSLAGCTVLLVGYGGIGKALDRRLRACDARVIRVSRTAVAEDKVHDIADLSLLLPEADIVVLAVPLTTETAHLIDHRELSLLRDGSLVVNVSRGPVIRTEAILNESSRLRFAVDVTDPEPLSIGHPLWDQPNVLVTPHVGGGSSVFDSLARRFVAEQVARFLDGTSLRNIVSLSYP